MHNFISEDDIEQAILKKIKQAPFSYDIIVCDADPSKREDLNDGTGRSSKKQCVLPNVMLESLERINPTIDKDKIAEIANGLCVDFTGTELVATNYKLYKQVRNMIKVSVKRNGRQDFDFVKLIDFDHPENNTFTAVSQMWIQGRYNFRRPDVLIFVNGMPLVFIELKNSIVKVEEAYEKNLKSYIKDIPNLFAFNQICVLSNGLETKLGAFNATYDFFFEWLKIESEKEEVSRTEIKERGVSVEYFVDGLLNKERLIDYIENFILFENESIKIIAKNHQFHGVNNLVEAVKNREDLQGKLGVFWHTQGSGKSYSMVMFVRKIKKKIPGNFTFLVITDRTDLDTQIHKNFVRTEVLGPKEECQPKNGAQLREYLTTNKSMIFTLIHKFKLDKKKKETTYPVLSERDDIIVLVDEAHRTQYKDLAQNMRTALPNANFVAFTGTPLLGTKRLTNQWFGEGYVSEYNFAQSIEDGSTVPLFYSRRVPEVGLQNDFLDDDVVDIIEDENLNEDETRLLENSSSRILEVIKRDDRLNIIAKDIAHHFPRRGFRGKGMVVSVDKYTAVKMYDKVKHYWNEEIKEFTKQRDAASTEEEREKLKDIIKYMNKVEMAVIISEEADEEEKFKKQELDISHHRKKMQEITAEGEDIEYRFKNPKDNLQLVFVCAMWLTGFDVKNLSTLYLDKPMKSHTLMQAIARANRVYPNKPCGIIVDYVNVFNYLEKALSDYATGDDGDEFPTKDIDALIGYIDSTIEEADTFLKKNMIELTKVMDGASTFDKLDELRKAYDTIVANDEIKTEFKVTLNCLMNLYDASKPEIFEKHWDNEMFPPLVYLNGLLHQTIDDEKIKRARVRMGQLLDGSVNAQRADDEHYDSEIHGREVIDLSKIDVEELRKEIKKAEYKAVEIDDLKVFIDEALKRMINRNCTRQKFSDRFKGIIDRYNAGGSENEDYYEQLIKLIEDLKNEEERPLREELSEEELEIYDLLISGKKLTAEDQQNVKLASRNLYKSLIDGKEKLLVVDWYKDAQPLEIVKKNIEISLDDYLPKSYDKESFQAKTSLLLNHFIDMAVQRYGWISRSA